MILLQYVNPFYITFKEFTDSVISLSPNLTPYLPDADELNWKFWADALSAIYDLDATPPSTEGYTDWRAWAVDLMAPY